MNDTNPITVTTDVQNQKTSATLHVPGTDLELEYDSGNYATGVRDRFIDVSLTANSSGLIEHVVEIDVAGQHHEITVPADEDSYTFEWDGLDGEGRPVQGTETATVRVGNTYDGRYASPGGGSGGGGGGGGGDTWQTFNSFGGSPISGSRTRQEVTVWREYERELRNYEPDAVGFAGWQANRLRDPIWTDTSEGRADASVVENVYETSDEMSGPKAFGPDGTLYTFDTPLLAIDRETVLEETIPDSGIVSPPTVDPINEDNIHESASIILQNVDGNINPESMAVGPDGSIYVADLTHHRIHEIDPDTGAVETLAGDGRDPMYEGGYAEDLVPNDDLGAATDTPLRPYRVAVGPEGDVYFAEVKEDYNPCKTVRRVTKSGRIEAIAGGPTVSGNRGSPDGQNEYDVAPTDTEIAVTDLAVGDDGTVYVSDGLSWNGATNTILSVEPDGVLRLFAGDPSNDSYSFEDGISPTDATYHEIGLIETGPNGGLFLVEELAQQIQWIRPDGTVWGILGDGSFGVPVFPGDRATSGHWDTPGPDMAVAPDGTVVIGGGNEFGDLARVRTSFADVSLYVDPSGRDVHDIPARHETTEDALTGATRRTLEYDADGKVTAFVDAYDNRTTVERDAEGDLAAIEAPNGQRTTFATDKNGYLETVTLPDGREISLTFRSDGLLTRAEDPAGNVTTVSYDLTGRVEQRTDPDGTTDLVRTELSNGVEIKRISPEMQEVTHTIERDDGDRRFTSTCCGGTESSTVLSPDGTWTISRRDGGSRTLTQGPDPRFGMLAPVTERAEETSPGGRTSITETERSVTLADRTDPLSVESHTETVTVNGRTFERAFDGSTDELTVTSPAGRSTVFTLDGNGGEVTDVSADGVDPVTLGRTGTGRIDSLTQAGATTQFEYGPNDYLTATEDATGHRTEFGRDVVGRITSMTAAADTGDAATDSITYDDAGNLTDVERPNGDVHGFGQDGVGRMTSYEPPEGGSVDVTYDGDGLTDDVVQPSGRTVSNTYTAGGRLDEATHPDATVSYTRDSAGRPTAITRTPSDGGSAQTVSIGRDGLAITSLAYSGAVSGTFEYAHDANGFVTGITFPEDVDPDADTETHAITHDDDGLTTGYGPFTYTRDGPNGAPTEITDGTLTITYTYDNRGRVDTRTHDVAGTTVYAVEYTYDAANRVQTRTETVDGTELSQETFTYDEAGRVESRTLGHGPDESYDYDANGNRTARTLGGTTYGATYLAGDRIDELDVPDGSGGTTVRSYDHDADGFVTDRGGDALSYSAQGELLDATLADGTTIEYTTDPYGRIVARTEGGNTTEYLYGDPDRPWQVTVARDPDGTRTRYYYDPFGHLVALERGGTWHYVATDQVGSPRVVAATDGSVEKEVERDSYGAVLDDSNASFTLHLGFAGGIRDRATGLVRFGVRDYDPAAGCFAARDPILMAGGQWNYYSYVDGDPVNGVDPSGLGSCWWQETLEDYNTTMDNIDPVNKAVNEAMDAANVDKTGPQDSASDLAKTAAKDAAEEGIKEGAEQFLGGASKKAAAKAAGKAAVRTGAKSAGQGALVSLALHAGAFTGAGISNMWDRSLSDRLAEGLMETDPLGLQTVDDPSTGPPGGGGSDCGQKSPENC